MKSKTSRKITSLFLAFCMAFLAFSAVMPTEVKAENSSEDIGSSKSSEKSVESNVTPADMSFGMDMDATLNEDDPSIIDVVLSIKDIKEPLCALEYLLCFDASLVEGVVQECGGPMDVFMTKVPMYIMLVPGYNLEIPVRSYEQISTYEDGYYHLRFVDLLDYQNAKPGQTPPELINDGDIVMTIQFRILEGVAEGITIPFHTENVRGTTAGELDSVFGATSTASYTIPKTKPEKNPSFSGASLTLQDNLNVNYKADASLFGEGGYENPYVIFSFNGVETIVSDYRIEGNKYVFDFTDIAPHQMGDTIYSTLYATHNGEEYASKTREYSVLEYCNNAFDNYGSDEYAELRTLLVDLLNYGAMAQMYMSYKVDDLVNASLTDTQKAWGTSTDREIESIRNLKYETIANPTVSWKGAGLNLEESIAIRLKISAQDIEGMSLRVTTSAGSVSIDSSKFFETTGGHYVFVDCLCAAQVSETVYITVLKDNVAVSNTLRYSIESYAADNMNSVDENGANLLKAMIRYGDSAKAYADKISNY